MRPGDKAVYWEQQTSEHPPRGARDVSPSKHGETYTYMVKRYLVVEAVIKDGAVLCHEEFGGMTVRHLDDPHLCKATWWERLVNGHRFPK